MPAPTNDQKSRGLLCPIAGELGFDLTSDEIMAGLKGMERNQKAQADKVSLDDTDLENMAGGVGDPRCAETFDQGEWCWLSDSCSIVISYYDDQPAQDKPSGSLLDRVTFYHGEPTKPDIPDAPDDPFYF